MKNIDRLPFPSMIDDFLSYSAFNSKAYRIYRLCLANNKYKWACEIKKKYNVSRPKHDITDAFGLALFAAKSKL